METARPPAPGQEAGVVWRLLHRLFWIVGTVAKLAIVCLVLGAIAVGLLVLRLAHGPLSIDALAPLIEATLGDPDANFRIRIAATELWLADDRRSIEIRTHDARIENRAGATLAVIPELSLGLSVEALLDGVVAPTRIIVLQPRLRVARDADGSFQLGIGSGNGTSGELAQDLMDEFLASPAPSRRARALREISVRDASLTVDDRMLGTSWQARRAALTLFRNPQGMRGDLAIAVDVDDKAAELHGDFIYAAADHRLAVNYTIADWDFARLQHIVPALRPLAVLHATLNGSVDVAIDTASQRIDAARVELAAGSGALVDPALPGGAMPIAGAELRASYDKETARITLHELTLDLAGPTASIKGTVDGVDAHVMIPSLAAGSLAGEIRVASDVVVQGMPTNDLQRFWPVGLGTNARNWITANIHDGAVDEARLSTRFRLAPGADPAIDAFGGSLKMHGLTVDYKHPLPPVRGVDGSATFDQKTMTLLPTSGMLKGLRVIGGTIVITDLDVVDQWINIQLDVSGPVRDALEVIDSKPFEYAHQVGIDPARVDGTATSKLKFYFMLDHRTTFDQVEIGVKAQLAGLALRKVAFGQDLTDGNLQLVLDRGSLTLDGTGRLAGAPATIGWVQYFKARDGQRSRYTVRMLADETVRRAVGLDMPSNVSLAGPVDLDATMTSFTDKRARVQVALDLRAAAIAVPDLNWQKPLGGPARARLDIDMVDDHVVALRDASATGPGIELSFAAAFGRGDQGLQRVDVRRLALGETDLRGSLARRPEGGWRVELRGLALDATGLMGNLNKQGGAREDEPPLVVDAKLDRVILGPKREARDVTLQLLSDGTHWQSIRLDAVPLGTGSLKLTFGAAGGERPFNLTINDLGATLRLLDISDHLAGGQVAVTGRAIDQGKQRTFVGHLDGGDYRLVRAPVFAKLLSLASFTSIASLLSGEGIPFTRMISDFSMSNGKLAVKQFRTYGGAIGLNANGTIDLDNNVLDLDGTLVPAYTLNSILGNIPVIGNLLLGGEGQGLFAAVFRAEGPLDDPKISVNPLSSIMPGALRNLFNFDSGSSGVPTAKEPGASK